MEHDSKANSEPPVDWMARLLIGMDESMRLGMKAEQLSSVGSELSPAEFEELQGKLRCLELLNHFRAPNPSPSRSLANSNDSTFDDDLPSAHDLAFEGTDRYRVQHVLGAGAMGVVYEVFDEQRQTTAALKKLRQTEPARILRFKDEFRRLTNVAHPNIVTLFELVQVENDWFIAMELLEGTNFLDALSQRNIRSELASSQGASPRALGQLCGLFQQLAAGLQTLHQAGILHRDLKPNNVLVTPDDRVVIIDFGLAADFDWRQLQGTPLLEFAGTFAYMAPEQVVCEPLTPAGDWYSFGVMLYQALTGELPIAGPHALHTKQYLSPPSLQQQLPGLPPGWAELGQALLASEASDRPTGLEVAERLRELQAAASKTNYPTVTNLQSLRGNAQESRTLFGRERELDQLRAAMNVARDGQPMVVTIHGTSGIGKTTLVESFLSELADDVLNASIVTLRGRCHERESLPYKTLDSLVDSLCKHLRLATDELEDLLPRNMALLCRVFPVLSSVKTINPLTPVAEESSVAELDADPVWLRRRAFDALRELLLTIAQHKPLVLFIDDLQWGDMPGASVLAELFHSDSTAKMMWILAYRAEQSSTNPCLNSLHLDQLPRLTSHSDVSIPSSPRFAHHEIAVGPLNSTESAQLAANLMAEFQGSSGSQALHEAIADESGGMPFYVQQLVRHAIGIEEPDHEIQPGKVEEGISLNSVLRDRVASLPEIDRQVMWMVAIAGQPICIDVVCEAINMPTVDERQLHQLSVNRWLRSNRESNQTIVTVFHDQIRESIVSSLAIDVKQQLHINLADSLERSESTTPETLAYHFDAGNEPGRACHYLRLAGKHAQNVFAFEKAIEHFRRALELSSTAAERFEMSRSLGEACSQAGRGGEAAEALLQAAELADRPSEALELRLAAARQYCISGYTDEGRRLVRAILAASGMYFPKGFIGLVLSLLYQRARLSMQGLKVSLRPEEEVASAELQRIDMMWSAVSGLSFQEPVAVASLHTQGLRAALAAGEPKRVVRALAIEAILSATPGPKTRPRVERLLEQTNSLAGSSTDSDTLGMLNLAKGGTAFLQVRMPDAVAPLIEAEKLFSSRIPKAWWELTTARSLLAWAYMHMGDFCALKRCLELYQQDAQDRGDLFLLSSIRSAGIPQLQLAADQPELAQEGLDRLEQSVPYRQFQQRHVSMLYSQAQIDLYCGNGLASWKRIHDNWSLFRKSMQLQNQFARVSLIDLRARCALSSLRQNANRDLLRNVRADLARLKREVGTWVQPFVSRLEAGIHEAQGAPDEAQLWLRRASQEFAAIGFRGCALGAQRRQGQLMNNSRGLQLIAEADAYLKSQAVVDAEAFQRVLC